MNEPSEVHVGLGTVTIVGPGINCGGYLDGNLTRVPGRKLVPVVDTSTTPHKILSYRLVESVPSLHASLAEITSGNVGLLFDDTLDSYGNLPIVTVTFTPWDGTPFTIVGSVDAGAVKYGATSQTLADFSVKGVSS